MSLAKNKLFHDKREHNLQINHLNVSINNKRLCEKICHLIIFVVKIKIVGLQINQIFKETNMLAYLMIKK